MHVSFAATLLAVAFALLLSAPVASGQAIPTRVISKDGKWQLLRANEPYRIRGAGGSASLELLREIGGNSVRTWGADHLDEKLDAAQKLGLSVCVGIWLGHERHGFKYDSPEQVKRQYESARAQILKYKDHPAVLMWGIGNEMEGYAKGDNPNVWKAVNDIAKLAHEVDPNHPTMTVTAEIGGARVRCIRELCPDIDIHGINTYAGVTSIPKRYREAGGTKPYVITEFGPPGTWETAKTPWDKVQELTSTAKAEHYRRAWTEAIDSQPDLALGGYCFNWGAKREATETWFGMFLSDGTKLAAVDVMAELWTGHAPANRCPKIEPIVLSGPQRAAPGASLAATIKLSDPDGDAIQTEWVFRREPDAYKEGGDHEDATEVIAATIVRSDTTTAELRLPGQHGAYRLYAIVRDGRGAGATANVPLLVESPAK